jgi:integrase
MSAKIVLITPEQEEAIFAEIGADPARDYLRFLLATGCRPEEGATIEARHLQETPNGVLIVLGVGEHKTGRKTGKQRIIYCGAVASEIVRRLALRYPAGKLFRTRAGSTWLPSTRVGWFSRLRDRVQAERGKDFCPDTISLYACRHTFATRKLAEGKPIAHVAELLGNTIAVCQTHYGHLALMGNVLWSCVA